MEYEVFCQKASVIFIATMLLSFAVMHLAQSPVADQTFIGVH